MLDNHVVLLQYSARKFWLIWNNCCYWMGLKNRHLTNLSSGTGKRVRRCDIVIYYRATEQQKRSL